jgi:hypothetical protein
VVTFACMFPRVVIEPKAYLTPSLLRI